MERAGSRGAGSGPAGRCWSSRSASAAAAAAAAATSRARSLPPPVPGRGGRSTGGRPGTVGVGTVGVEGTPGSDGVAGTAGAAGAGGGSTGAGTAGSGRPWSPSARLRRAAVAGLLGRRALGDVGVVQAGLDRPQARAALALEARVLLQRLLAGVVGARPDEGADLEDVVVLVEDRRRRRLVVDVLQQRLEAGVALAAGAARVLLDGVLAIVEVPQDDRQVLARARGCRR